MFTWIKGNTNTLILTLYPSNITLNSSAASYFKDTRWCMVGIDHDSMRLAIKPVTKRELDLGLVDQSQLHKISIGNGYGRITNKSLMEEIALLFHESLEGQKMEAYYSEEDSMLIANFLTDEHVYEG